MNRWSKATEAVIERGAIGEEQKLMLLNQADLLDNRESALIADAHELADRFKREADKLARGVPWCGFRSDKACALQSDYAVFEMHAQCYRASVRMVLGAALAAEFDKALSK